MKKLLFIALLISTLAISAQEKQNNATWDETISFLEKYKSSISQLEFENRFGYQEWIDSGKKYYGDHYFNINFKQGSYFINSYYFQHPWSHSPKAFRSYKVKVKLSDLQLLKGIEKGKWNEIRIVFLEPCVQITAKTNRTDNGGKYNDTGTHKLRWIEIEIDNEEIMERYKKALIHLAYLAKEKRKKSEKDSGDKF